MFLHKAMRSKLTAGCGTLQRTAAGHGVLLGCVLAVAGCTLDAKPRPLARDESPGPDWMPPSASEQNDGRDSPDAAATATSERPGAGDDGDDGDDGMARADAGASQASGGAGAQPMRDAGRAESDAASPADPVMRDASTPTPTPARDAGMSPEADASTPPSTPSVDAATAPPAPSVDASTPPPTPTADASTAPPTPTPDAGSPPPTPTAGATAPPATPDAGPPPAASSCTPGMYSGNFRGAVFADGEQLANVTGRMRAELVLDSTGTRLVLRDGRVTGSDRDENRLTVSLTGSINCTTLELEQGALIDGSYFYEGSRMSFTFQGTLDGTYSPDPPSVNGTWSGASDDIALITAQGTWNLQLDE
jgi:cytoskeletal protein CcmA (bactofilin family)